MEKPYTPKAIQRKIYDKSRSNPILYYISCTDIYRSLHGNSWVTASLYSQNKDQFNIITR